MGSGGGGVGMGGGGGGVKGRGRKMSGFLQKLELYQFFSFMAPSLWDSLPATVRNVPTLSQFKSHLQIGLHLPGFWFLVHGIG